VGERLGKYSFGIKIKNDMFVRSVLSVDAQNGSCTSPVICPLAKSCTCSNKKAWWKEPRAISAALPKASRCGWRPAQRLYLAPTQQQQRAGRQQCLW
jgi:hypothetical protein